MITIASLLDHEMSQEIKGLWDVLEQEVGLREVKMTPFPHFTWQSANDYQLDKIELNLQEITKKIQPFKIYTSGLGIFTGDYLTIMITVVKNRIALDLHQQIWQTCKDWGTQVNPYHNPDYWTPHITIANKDVTNENIARVLSKLDKSEFHYEMFIDNLAILYKSDNDAGVKSIYKLGV
jgi:2'-5' RNA ligase